MIEVTLIVKQEFAESGFGGGDNEYMIDFFQG
jgi:hypothetical protein